MLTNLKFAFCSLARGRGKVLPRILSLTLGLALGVYLLSYVNYRFNYDCFLPDNDRIYKVFMNAMKDGGGIDELTYAPLAHSLMRDCPGVEAGTRMYRHSTYNWMDENGKEYEMTAYTVDSLFFRVLDFGLMVGDARLLNESGHIFISEEKARLIFGSEDPLGKILKDNVNNSRDIAGIFRTSPYNTSLGKFDILLSDGTEHHNYDVETCWDGTNEFISYVKLRPGATPDEVEDWMNGGMLSKYKIREILEKFQIKYMLVPVRRAEVTVGTRRQYMDFITILAILVLALSALNYALLSISSLVNRSRTVAVMRCTAAEKKDIWAQFMWETFFVMLAAGLLTVLTIIIFRDPLSSTIESPVAELFRMKNIWVSVLVVIVLFFGAGMIPATLFASIPTVVAFRGISDNKKGWKRALLVFEIICVSFASAFLLVSVRQINLLREGDLGYNPDNLVYAMPLVQGGDAILNMERDLESLSCVDVAGSSYGLPINGYMPSIPYVDETTGEVLFPFALERITPSYFDVMEIKIIDGQGITEFSPAEDVIVNKRFVDMAGIQDGPVGRTISQGDNDGNITARYKIAGVVENVRTTEEGRFQPIVYMNIRDNLLKPEWYYGGFRTVMRLNDMSQKSYEAVTDRLRNYQSMDKYSLQIYKETFRDKMKGEYQFKNLMLIIFMLTMAIALLGLGGYISDDLKCRRKEIALRKVCGAEMSDIIGIVAKDFSVIALPSIIVGELLSYVASGKWLQMFEYRLPLDWWMFTVTGLLVLLVIVITISLLTISIASTNPAESFKTE